MQYLKRAALCVGNHRAA